MREERYWGREENGIFRMGLSSFGKFRENFHFPQGQHGMMLRAHFLAKMLHPLSSSTALDLANCLGDLVVKRKPTE